MTHHDEEVARLRKLATEAIEALIGVCDWHMARYDVEGNAIGYRRVWGYAEEYVEAFAQRWAIRQDAPRPADFNINRQWRSVLGLDDEVQP